MILYFCTAIVTHQMTTLEEIQLTISSELADLNHCISGALKSDNALMQTIIDGYLKSHGKQIRPIMVILTAKLFGTVTPEVISAAAAVEMLHNASLIHDDVIDETKLRRGRPTINSIWDNHIAVLIGDFFVSNSLSQAILTGDIRIVKSVANLGTLLSVGEMDQIYNARQHQLNEEAYFHIINHKTASLFVACVEMGGYAANAPEKAIAHMRKYAELLGLCFQIKDDIFDYYADTRIGKPTGNDLREGKVTLPLLYALSRTELPDHDDMTALVATEELSTEQIDTLIEFAKRNGGIDYAYSTMASLSAKAMDALKDLAAEYDVDPHAYRALTDIMSFIITRNK